jgi:hypothetical protein
MVRTNEFGNTIESLFIDGYYIEVETLPKGNGYEWCASYKTKGLVITKSHTDKDTAIHSLVIYLHQELL